MTDRVVLGVDGGGTKTDVCVATDAGRVLAFVSGAGSNWEGVGLDAVGATLRELIAAVLADAGISIGQVDAASFCLAGIDWPSDEARLGPVIEHLGLACPWTVDNDSFAALRAGSERGVGCVSIAGTGGVAAGRNAHGEVARTMGIAIGEGSGAWGLVAEALAAMARARNRGGAPTDLTDRLLRATNCDDVSALFEGLSRGTVHVGGALSVHVIDAARDGDAVAQTISRSCGAEHGRDVVGVATRLGLTGDVDVVLAGGVHTSGEAHFRAGFVEEVDARFPNAHLRVLDAPPVAGAVLLALDQVGAVLPGIHEAVCVETGAARSAGATQG